MSKPFGEDLHDAGRRGDWRGRGDAAAFDPAIEAPAAKLDRPGTALGRGQPAAKGGDHVVREARDILRGRDGLRKGAPDRPVAGRRKRGQGDVALTGQCVEPLGESVAEARHQAAPRHASQVPDPAQAEPVELVERRRIETQRGAGQGIQDPLPIAVAQDRRAALAGAHVRRWAEARQCPGRRRRSGDRRAGDDAAALQPRERVAAQSVLVAMQMRGARDVEQQSVGRIEGHVRSVAFRPARQFLEETSIGSGVVGDNADVRKPGAGVREAEARAKPGRPGAVVDGGQAQRAALADGHDTRRPDVAGCWPRPRGGGFISRVPVELQAG
jgi:hypothetical protein